MLSEKKQRAEIIAEIGQNHNGDMELAAKLIREAKLRGADVAKFQVYDAKALFPKDNNPWYDYNCKTELSRAQLNELYSICNEEGIEFVASVFDVERIAWLEDLGVARYKIAARSFRDKEFISTVAETGKPVLVSIPHPFTGDLGSVSNEPNCSFLYCISLYPTPLEKVKLQNADFNRYVGFSDHTLGISAPLAALSRGAKIIEKHFTLDKSMYGPDHACSMTPEELSLISSFRDDLEKLM